MVLPNITSKHINDSNLRYRNMKQFDSMYEEDIGLKFFMSGFLTITFILSFVGNICTCAVIIRDRSMRTPTNCYLFNLAVTDFLTALCIPVEIYIKWMPDYFPIDEIGCRIHFVLWGCLSNCSALTIFAFTVERYVVITKPFQRQSLLLTSRVVKIVAFIWMLSCLFSMLQVYNIILIEKKTGIYCFYKISQQMQIVITVDLFIFFIVPMTVIFVIYVLIALKLKHTNMKLKSSPANGKRNRDKAITMLAAVAASFFFCWFPYCVLRLMLIIPRWRQDDYSKTWKVFVYMSTVNGYLSTAVNPILYSLMSRKFQQAFKNLLDGQKPTIRLDTLSKLHSDNSVQSGIRLNNIRHRYSF
ncbi:unnamed protein product [Parnassius mnemosyne]|uniref:G-protein coupled receptors family 1 profile domain-containing protein n=1 Tax=Parnassius mnemosyne TaxID=213953 RepID=A0AAV1M1T8_9NEOP